MRSLVATAVGAVLAAVALTAALGSVWQPAAGGWGRPTPWYPGEPWRGPAHQTLGSAHVDIGRLWGHAFQGRASVYESLATTEAEANQLPGGASLDPAANTVRFSRSTAAITIVANPPNGRDMAFRAAGLENPTIEVRRGARVRVRFVNGDSDAAHGWLLLNPVVHVGSMVHGPRAFPGAFAPILGDPTNQGQAVETITFRATRPGTYRYECPVPGHAAMGMQGTFVVSA